ncbi:hypothetical protein [Falsirhodobacter halotolerans]|uniref:hypothetical protein n=1 Tax=Falsirhodobacter halotolerans TaxID=1146892 RepID=UPI001FD3486E|nr:hypothetical protein [Falsirhodobacter halotolerans]MCJ8138631.1 hypothetical protein [Falsirhodobacter halotolerans]
MTDLHIEPITDVRVGSVIATCGMCGSDIEIEHKHLDHETGRVCASGAFKHCPECEGVFDATASTFSAYLEANGEKA